MAADRTPALDEERERVGELLDRIDRRIRVEESELKRRRDPFQPGAIISLRSWTTRYVNSG